jgi:hypothetical protein
VSDTEATAAPAPAPVTESALVPVPNPASHTWLQHGIQKPKVYLDGSIRYGNLSVYDEPGNTQSALFDPRWKHAMDLEFFALVHNKTWHLVPPRRDRNLIDYKWVYKIKRKVDGSIDRYKSCLVAKGFKQCYLTMMTHLALLLNLLLFFSFCLLLSLRAGVFIS